MWRVKREGEGDDKLRRIDCGDTPAEAALAYARSAWLFNDEFRDAINKGPVVMLVQYNGLEHRIQLEAKFQPHFDYKYC